MGQLTWPIWAWACWGGAALLLVVGLSLLLLALWRDKGRKTRRCPKCWYELTGVPGLTCPECGRAAQSEKAMFRRRWRRGWSVIAVLLLVASGGLAVWPKVARDGWLAVTPTTVLIAAWPRYVPAEVLAEVEMRIAERDLWDWQKVWRTRKATSIVRSFEEGEMWWAAFRMLRHTQPKWSEDRAVTCLTWVRLRQRDDAQRAAGNVDQFSEAESFEWECHQAWSPEETDHAVQRVRAALKQGQRKDELWSAILNFDNIPPTSAALLTKLENGRSFLPERLLEELCLDPSWADMLVLGSRAVLNVPPHVIGLEGARVRIALIERFAPNASGAARSLAKGISTEIDLARIRRDLVVMYVLAPWHPEAARSIGLIGPDDAWFTLWRRVILARADRNPAEVARLLAEAIRSERVDRRKLGIEMVALLLVDDPQIRAALAEAKARSGADAAAASAALEQLSAAAATPSTNTPR